MLIRYSRKRLRSNLLLGSVFTAIGLLMVKNDPTSFIKYGYILMGLLCLGTWIFERMNQYLLISDGVLTKNKVRPTSMCLSEVNRIVEGHGNITLYSQKDRLRINTGLLDKRSLKDLHRVLDNLELGAEETFICKISSDPTSK